MIIKIIILILALLLGFMLFRTWQFKPKAKGKILDIKTDIDYDSAIKKFQELIRIPTVSYVDGVGEDDEVFEELINRLPSLFPNVYEKCEYQRVGKRGLLFHWKGTSSEEASVFMAHFDVVPVEPQFWDREPFCGEIIDGELWGRGTLDTKGTFTATLEIANTLIGQGFVPKNDIWLAFSGQEEVHGPAAEEMANLLKSKNVNIKFVLDEGGAVVEHILPGADGRIAVIGIGEKGMMNFNLNLTGDGGHASQPPQHTLVGKMSQIICNLENNPMPMHVNKPFLELIDNIGRDGSFKIRFAIANFDIFKHFLNKPLAKMGGEINAMLRTTFAFTELSGSKAVNVMASNVVAGVNIRSLMEDNKDSIIAHIKEKSGNPDLNVECLYSMEGSNYSRTDVESYERLKTAIQSTWQDVNVTPYLMIAASDARYYSKFNDRVYRFSAMEMTKAERKLIHGHNERIRIEEWKNALDFYYRIMKMS